MKNDKKKKEIPEWIGLDWTENGVAIVCDRCKARESIRLATSAEKFNTVRKAFEKDHKKCKAKKTKKTA